MLQRVLKSGKIVSTQAAFENPFMWLLASFGNPLMTTQAAFDKIGRIIRVSVEAYFKKFSGPLKQFRIFKRS
jgi:hypothetical protein